MTDKIYRDCELPRLSAEKSQKFLHAIAASGTKITSHFSLTNGFSCDQMTYHSLFFRFIQHVLRIRSVLIRFGVAMSNKKSDRPS